MDTNERIHSIETTLRYIHDISKSGTISYEQYAKLKREANKKIRELKKERDL